jgi:hypothetical protein
MVGLGEEGRSYEDIAEIVGVGTSTVSRIVRSGTTGRQARWSRSRPGAATARRCAGWSPGSRTSSTRCQPTYSPLNPVECLWADLKRSLRTLAINDAAQFRHAVRRLRRRVPTSKIAGWFRHTLAYAQIN